MAGSRLQWHIELSQIAVNRIVAAHVGHAEASLVNQLLLEDVLGLGGGELATGHSGVVGVEFLEGDGAVVLLELVFVDGVDGMLQVLVAVDIFDLLHELRVRIRRVAWSPLVGLAKVLELLRIDLDAEAGLGFDHTDGDFGASARILKELAGRIMPRIMKFLKGRLR